MCDTGAVMQFRSIFTADGVIAEKFANPVSLLAL
jgi:hypothetical protein